MPKHVDYAPLDPLPAHWTDAIQELVSGLTNFTVRIKPSDATKLEVPAGSNNAQVGVVISGRYRYITATVERASIGGGARTLDLWVTAADNVFGTTVISGITCQVDNTDHSFALALTEHGAGPPVGPAISREVAEVVWDGAAFTAIRPVMAGVLVADLAAGVASLRTLGTGATQAVAGNDGRLSDTRTPTDNTVTSAKIVDGTIVNADVAAAAAIARSKLDFGGGLVNADIAAAAAIAYSKLNLSASILSADIVDGTLVDADVAAAADIAGTKIKPAARTSLTRPTNVNAVGHCSARLDLKDVVRLEGGVVNNTGGTIAAGGLVATVPAGFRPASQAHAIVPINGYPQHMTIATDGSLRFPTASTLNGEEVDFDGVTFTTT